MSLSIGPLFVGSWLLALKATDGYTTASLPSLTTSH